MVCVEYGGIIYFHDDGQVIREFLDDGYDNFTEWAKNNRVDAVEFVKKYIELAKIEQLRTGIPWQHTLTQMALESKWGSVYLVDIEIKMQSYNLYGIKNLDKKDVENYVRDWTTEDILTSQLDEWKKKHNDWAKEGEGELSIVKEKGNNVITIKVIQPFRRFDSYEEGMAYHSDLLLDDRYAEAWKYEDNPFIYLAIIAPIYATATDYEATAVKIMDDYFMWEDKTDDWEKYDISTSFGNLRAFDVYRDYEKTEYLGKYYLMYVGEQWEDHSAAWAYFYVSENFDEVLWCDVVMGKDSEYPVLYLDEWRESDFYPKLDN